MTFFALAPSLQEGDMQVKKKDEKNPKKWKEKIGVEKESLTLWEWHAGERANGNEVR